MNDAVVGPHDGRRDIERAAAELAERLPNALQPLARLAFNYRWSWTSGVCGARVWGRAWNVDLTLVIVFDAELQLRFSRMIP